MTAKYKAELSRIINEGKDMLNERTGVVCRSVFGSSVKYSTGELSPMPTLRKGFFTGVKVELAWILKGLTNTNYLHQHKVYFWDKWMVRGGVVKSLEDVIYMHERVHGKNNPTLLSVLEKYEGKVPKRSDKPSDYFYIVNDLGMLEGPGIAPQYNDAYKTDYKYGDLGPVYGAMLRNFPNPDGTTTDQLQTLIDGLITNPTSRRHIVSLWCPFYLPDESISPQENVLKGKQALPPCHFLWNFKVEETVKAEELGKKKYTLNLHFNMRSNDYPVGNLTNIPFYDLLLRLVAQTVGMEKGELWYTCPDAHVYSNQLEDCKTVLERDPLPLPLLELDPEATVFDFEPHMAKLIGYQHHDNVNFEVTV